MGCAFRFEAAWESATRNPASEWDVLSFCGLWRKLRPRSRAQNGMHFPVEASNGKCIPVFCEKRDVLSGACLRRAYTPHRAISGPPAQTFLPLLRHFTDRSVVCPHARVYSKRYFSCAIRCRLSLHDPKGAVMERILGVNLSGWFIPEPWVTPSLYAATGASNAAELQEAMGTACLLYTSPSPRD